LSLDPLVVAGAGSGFIAAGGRAVRIPAAGPISKSPGVPLALAPSRQEGWGIAASSDRTFALWSSTDLEGKSRLQGARFDRFGRCLDATPIIIADGMSGAVASDGRDFMVATISGGVQRLFSVNGDDGK